MAKVNFTPNLERHITCPATSVAATTVGEALESVFADNPRLRGYVLDDQGHLRKHVLVFIDGVMVNDRKQLSDPLREESEVFVMQALSGG